VNVYTKKGDMGMTDLLTGQRVNKTDLHIEVLGTIDELTSSIGLIRSMSEDPDVSDELLGIQKKLKDIMAVVARDFEHEIDTIEDIRSLEKAIDRYQLLFPPLQEFVYSGDLSISAQIDLTRTIARRAERRFAALISEKNAYKGISSYLNRLSDYLFVLARMLEFKALIKKALENTVDEQSEKTMSLSFAKQLAEQIENEAKRMGIHIVISIANKNGICVLTHIMDEAYIISKGLAEKKAYTSAVLQMPTHALKELTQKGASLEGLEAMVEEKIITLGGGYPLKNNKVTYGAVGISGGSVEDDIYLASYAVNKTERKRI
jgi:cob(I)alamin adenosyltransferase